MVLLRAVLVAACLSGCRTAAPTVLLQPQSAPARTDASAGVNDPVFAVLLEESWNATMAAHPTWATYLGDRRFDSQLTDVSPEAVAAWRSRQASWLGRAKAVALDEESADAVTRALFVASISASLNVDEACDLRSWSLSARDNPLTELAGLAEMMTLTDQRSASALLARFKAAPAWVGDTISNLRRGVGDGRVANRASVALVIEQLERELALPRGERGIDSPLNADVVGLSPEQRAAFQADVSAALDAVDAALADYVAFLKSTILPVARDDQAPGLASLTIGSDCYRALIAHHTTLPLNPADVHEIGLVELARLHRELEVLGARVFQISDRAEIVARLRADPSLRFTSEDEVEAKAASALARAKDVMPAWFNTLPRAPCEVARVPMHEAPFTTIAYYMQPALDGSRPGRYYVNTYAPETRPRYEAEVLAYHESIPGHHLQIAIAQELQSLPSFRRHDGMTAMVEGWGLYSEQLADEMGLYSGDLDRVGANSFEQWRAARLVVDTGLHHFGWSRARAEAFMLENTPLAANNIVNEVDRYITTPGQALAYKVGQLEIWRLRRDAEARLGDRFDIRGFHDAVLTGGAVSLPVLGDRVDAWVRAVDGNP